MTESTKNNLSIDCTIRASVQAKMKMIIKRLLKQHGYPPDKTRKVLAVVMKQAGLTCQNESAWARYQAEMGMRVMVANAEQGVLL